MSRKGVKENYMFWSEVWSGLENQAVHPHQNFRGVPHTLPPESRSSVVHFAEHRRYKIANRIAFTNSVLGLFQLFTFNLISVNLFKFMQRG